MLLFIKLVAPTKIGKLKIKQNYFEFPNKWAVTATHPRVKYSKRQHLGCQMELLDFDSVCQISHSQTHMEPFSGNKKDRNISPFTIVGN